LRSVSLVSLLFLTTGCSKEVVEWDCGCKDAAVVPETAEGDAKADAETAGREVKGEEPWVGMACVEDQECKTGLCLTKEFLEGMGLTDVDVPAGMCSMLLCSGDADCGPSGLCFDASGLTGGMAIRICLYLCDEMADCRWQEGYSCYHSTVEQEEGEPLELAACLPDNLVVAIECDDGHCETQDPPGHGHCDELADCLWKEDYTCYFDDPEDELGMCIPDITVVSMECEDGHCEVPAVDEEPQEEE